MGSFFSNLHIKKELVSECDIENYILEYYLGQGCVQTDSDTADFEVNIYVPKDGCWMSVYCDAFVHTDILSLSSCIAKSSGGDVLGISCFDSDYLFLNLLNAHESRDLWLNIGNSPEIKKPRRSNVAAWKGSVKNFEAFRSAAKKDYVFAEEFLLSVQDELALPYDQSVGLVPSEAVSKMYFFAPQKEKPLPTKLEVCQFSLMPCYPGKREACFVNNEGAASRGIAVLFVGDYVEHDEITIDDAYFCCFDRHDTMIQVPITFTKRQLPNGRWVYFWEDKEFKLPRAVSPDLPPRIKEEKEHLNSFGIRYIPNGNKRKFLDITVVFVPLANPTAGQCFWRAWAYHPSKRQFVEEHNRTWSGDEAAPRMEELLLDPNEYDLD